MDIKPKFFVKKNYSQKKQYDKNVDNEVVKSYEESFKIDYFLYIVDNQLLHFKIGLNKLKYLSLFLGF